MPLPAQSRKTFNDVPTVGIPAFQEARQWIEKVCTGYMPPEEIQRMLGKAQRLMESRKAQVRRASRPSSFLEMHGDATVIRRPSGLLVPPKYRNA